MVRVIWLLDAFQALSRTDIWEPLQLLSLVPAAVDMQRLAWLGLIFATLFECWALEQRPLQPEAAPMPTAADNWKQAFLERRARLSTPHSLSEEQLREGLVLLEQQRRIKQKGGTPTCGVNKFCDLLFVLF